MAIISKSTKNSSTQLAINWSIRVTQYMPAYDTHMHEKHTKPLYIIHLHRETEQVNYFITATESCAKTDLPLWHMVNPGGRGQNITLQLIRHVWIWRLWGKRQAGRSLSPLMTRREILVCVDQTAVGWMFCKHHTELKLQIEPIPANWESKPTVKSMKKNKMDHSGEMGSLDRASG